VEAANKGGVRGEGVVGRLLTMARETGGGLVRHGGARRTATLGRLDQGREAWAGPTHQRGRRGDGCVGRLAGGLVLGSGEVGHDCTQSWRWAKVQKEIIFEFQLIFLEFGRTLENCTRKFRWNFDMGILPKIFWASQGFLEN
jgi:hypothetical protein